MKRPAKPSGRRKPTPAETATASEPVEKRKAKAVATLEEVRAGTASIKDSMARAVIEEERAERF